MTLTTKSANEKMFWCIPNRKGVSELIEEILTRLGVDEGSETFLALEKTSNFISKALHFVNLLFKILEGVGLS